MWDWWMVWSKGKSIFLFDLIIHFVKFFSFTFRFFIFSSHTCRPLVAALRSHTAFEFFIIAFRAYWFWMMKWRIILLLFSFRYLLHCHHWRASLVPNFFMCMVMTTIADERRYLLVAINFGCKIRSSNGKKDRLFILIVVF